MAAATSSAICFIRVAEATGRHVCFMATFADASKQAEEAWRREPDLTVTRIEFDDPDGRITSAIRAWLLATEQGAGSQPVMVMVGSTENGAWVNWKLQGIPVPPIPGA